MRAPTPQQAMERRSASGVAAFQLLVHLLRRQKVVRAAGLEPAQAFRPYGFSYHFGFRRPHRVTLGSATGSWSGLSLHPGVAALGAARLVSTPSAGAALWRLGSGLPAKDSPNLSSSAPQVSLRALKSNGF